MPEHPMEFFVELESQVWNALSRGDADADHALLSSDFLGVYATGFADRSDHTDQLADGPTVASYSITNPRLIHVSDSAVLLCYRAECRARSGADETMYISSLWTERDGRWLNTFSQDTLASAEPHSSQDG
jgi:hypothetical protein